MEQNQGRFRPRKARFAQISNTALHDENLSLKAKGLYSVIQSMITMPGADLLLWKIKAKCKEGSKAFDSAWRELKETGYLKQYRMPGGAKGAFLYEYELLDEPDLTTSATINLNKNGEIASFAEETDHAPQKGGGNDNTISDNTVLDNTKKSVSPSYNDGLTDFLRNQIKEQIEYNYFEMEENDNILTINALVDCMASILASPVTVINNVPQSKEALAPYIAKVDSSIIREFVAHMKGKSLKGVKNITSYYKSCFINYLREQELGKMVI